MSHLHAPALCHKRIRYHLISALAILDRSLANLFGVNLELSNQPLLGFDALAL